MKRCSAPGAVEVLGCSLKFLGLTLFTLLVLAGCEKPKAAAPDEVNYSALRQQVVQRVKAKQIAADASGVAVLPQDLAAASVNGQAWVAQDPGAGWLVAFPLTTAKMEFLLYADKPGSVDGKTIPVGPAALTAWRKVDEHWYQARAEAPAPPK